MIKKISLIAGTALTLAACGEEPEAPVQSHVNADNVRAHMEFLADDLLEGRETGTRGYKLAANYVATQYKLLGLEPGGTDGYFQPVTFRTYRLAEDSASAVLTTGGGEIELAQGNDFLLSANAGELETAFSGEVVFVGYGIHAPNLGHNDYEGADVAGKVVAYLAGAPEAFPSSYRAHYSSGTVKGEAALENGAIATIALWTPAMNQRRNWDRIAQNPYSAGFVPLSPEGAPIGLVNGLEGSMTLSMDGAAELLADAPTGFEDILALAEQGADLPSFDTNRGIRVEGRTIHDETASANVAGILRGSDPELADEYVIYTAHLDHIGINENAEGDQINNGAYDNASGTAAMIETARVMKQHAAPRRSVMFLAVTAEEKGLRGSQYFAHHPTVPLENIVANINLDMPVMMHEMTDMVAFGTEHSSLMQFAEAATAEVGLGLGPDPMPDQSIFTRSDQYRFVQQGVPAVFLWPGFGGENPSGQEAIMGFLQNQYHSPADELDLPFNMISANKFTQANLLVGLMTANAAERPTWNEDSVFGDIFGRDNNSQ